MLVLSDNEVEPYFAATLRISLYDDGEVFTQGELYFNEKGEDTGALIWLTREQTQELKDYLDKLLKETENNG